jgi:hypothetical protein
VENWINNLDNTQLVSQNSMNSVISNTPINNLINVGESVSNVGESVSNIGESILLEYAQSQTNFVIGSRAEYFNIISPQVDVTLEILEINQNRNMRCLKVTMVNNNLLEGEELFKGIYKTLMENKDFLNFGFQKIIILSVVLVTDKEYNLHSNVLINNESSFNEYYSTISHELDRYNNLQYGYHNEEISRYVMLAWNVDNEKNLLIKQTYTSNRLNPKKVNGGLTNHRNYSTYTNKWYKGLINPISLYNKKGILKQQHVKPLFTMDLETVYLESVNAEVVIAISSCGFNNGIIDNQIFLIDPKLLLINYELATQELWNKYFKYSLLSNPENEGG